MALTVKQKWGIAFGVVIAIIIAIILYAYRKEIFGNKKGKKGNGTSTGTGDESYFPLQYGSEGPYVTKLQEYLLSKDPNCLPKYGVDGIWKDETEACINSVINNNVVDYDYFKNYIA